MAVPAVSVPAHDSGVAAAPSRESVNGNAAGRSPPPTLATVAVKVTGASTSDGLAEEVRVVVVAAWFTVSARVPLLVSSFASPE